MKSRSKNVAPYVGARVETNIERLHVTVDTREQRPWSFPEAYVSASRGTVPVGDYALAGDEENFAVERKDLDDFLGSISSTWEQFLRRFEKVPNMPIVIEADFERVCFSDDGSPPEHNHPALSPGFVNKRIAELTFMKIPVLFAGRRDYAAALCWRILVQRKKEIEDAGQSQTD